MSTSPTRRRIRIAPNSFTGNISLGYYQNWNTTSKKWGDPIAGPLLSSVSYPSFYQGQMTRDETHTGPPYLEGGPFDTIRVTSCDPPLGVQAKGTYVRSDNLKRYIGGFSIPDNAEWLSGMSMSSIGTFLSGDIVNYPDMADWGDEGYARTRPQLEKAGAAVFGAELRDLPRMMKTSAGFFHDIWKGISGSGSSIDMRPKKAADHFLNHQFGWIPFISDLRKFYRAFDQNDALIAKLNNENGQWIRRKRTLKDETTSTVVGSGSGFKLFPNTSFESAFNPPWFVSEPTWQVTEEVSTTVSAVGKYRYYRPEFDKSDPDHMSAINRLKRQMTLFGARISPSNIYKATPWSWAIDWFTNLGDQIDKANDILVDSVAAKYLYVMQHQKRKRVFTQYAPFHSGTVVLQFTRLIETKQRREGLSPFGFGLSMASLTPRQLAIAGALGVSKGYL